MVLGHMDLSLKTECILSSVSIFLVELHIDFNWNRLATINMSCDATKAVVGGGLIN